MKSKEGKMLALAIRLCIIEVKYEIHRTPRIASKIFVNSTAGCGAGLGPCRDRFLEGESNRISKEKRKSVLLK